MARNILRALFIFARNIYHQFNVYVCIEKSDGEMYIHECMCMSNENAYSKYIICTQTCSICIAVRIFLCFLFVCKDMNVDGVTKVTIREKSK